MKIHELAEKTGLTAPTIRFYEKEGLLDSRHVHRKENNYRDYFEGTIDHLKLIKKLQSVGFSLSELKEAIQENAADTFTIEKAIEIIREKMHEIERKKAEFEEIHRTLNQMLENKISMMNKLENGKQIFPDYS
ncbi:MerR family transcriptional regulator [Bacillus gobiensis]|uniref:MerR family transcriptional regulator n=1 Tax=Bacillus gobiensis TaxID=1441095 RepID=UPI003D1CFB2B